LLSETFEDAGTDRPEAPAGKEISQRHRDILAKRLCMEIDAAEQSRVGLLETWRTNQEIHDVKPRMSTLNVVDGMESYNIPLVRQKADRIVGSVYSSITGVYPPVQVIDESDGGANAEDVERALANIADRAGFARRFKQAVRTAFVTNLGVMKVWPETRDSLGDKGARTVTEIKIASIHPRDICIYPAGNGTMDDASTIGDRRYEPVWKIKELQRAGVYYDDWAPKGADDQEQTSDWSDSTPDSKTDEPDPVTTATQQVEIWELVTYQDMRSLGAPGEDKGDGQRDWYLVTLARSEQKILSVEPYPYENHWYVDVRLCEGLEDRVYPDDSVAQTVQGQQVAFSDICTMAIQGSMQNAFPLVISKGPFGKTTTMKYGPAQIVEVASDIEIEVIKGAFDPGALLHMLEILEMNVDSLTGISQLGTGQNMPSGTTATAAAGFLQAQAEAKDNYTEAVAPSVERLWSILYEYLAAHFDDLRAAYGSLVPIEDEVDPETGAMVPARVRLARMRPRLEVTGKTGATNPNNLIQKLMFVLELASRPESMLDQTKVIDRVLGALDLPFSVEGLRGQAIVQQLAEIVQMLAMGQMMPEQALQALAETLQGATSGGMAGGATAPIDAGSGALGAQDADVAFASPAPAGGEALTTGAAFGG
jgi:hypothetical protein